MKGDFQRIVLEAAVIFFFGAVIGLSFNYRLVLNAFTGAPSPEASAPAVETESAFPVPVGLDTVLQLTGEGALLLDARPRELYLDGHLPGAVHLPLVNIDSAMASFRERVPLTTPLVCYCSGYGCPDSFDLGVLLLSEGYSDVSVYEGGLPEWRDAGHPIEGGPQ